MSAGRTAREEAQYQKFFYPGTETLINKLDIRDPKVLEDAERRFVETRMQEGLPSQARKLTYDGFKAIHRHLFQDVYEWAGQERTYTTGRGPAPFAVPEHIGSYLNDRFAKLKAEKNLVGLKPAKFAERAAEHVNEINAAHPFIEGNGRTQRTWLRVLGDNAGYKISLSSKDQEAWYEASRIGFERLDPKPMAKLITENLSERSRDHDRER